MADSPKKIVLYIAEGTGQKLLLDNDRYLILYEALPQPLAGEEESLEAIIGKFIDEAGDLEWGTPEAERLKWAEKCIMVGKLLFEWLVEGLDELEAALRNLTRADRIILHSNADIMGLPWEMLYAGERFLVQDCPIIRRPLKQPVGLPFDEADREGTRLGLPLRILGCSYSTPGNDVDPDDHWSGVEESLKELEDRRLVKLRQLNSDELFNLLVDTTLPENIDEVDIVHILAHGIAPDKEDVGILIENKPLTGEQIANNILAQLNRTRKDHKMPLVLLASCKSGQQHRSGIIQPLTEALLQRGVPAVVAMQYDVSLEAAKRIMAGIYQGLAEGQPLDVALQVGRRNTSMLNNTIEWVTPVVYSYYDDLNLLALLPLQDQRERQRYLSALRADTPYIEEFFPIQVVAVEDEASPDGPMAEGQPASKMASIHTNQRTDFKRRLDADKLFLTEDKQLQRRTTILLGEAGGGKSAIIDKFITDLIPASEEGQLSAELREYAYHPASYIPIRLSLKRIGTDEYSYRLRSLVRQGLVDIWSRHPDPDNVQTLPAEKDIIAWVKAGWTFLIILEDFQAIPDEDRNRVSLYLFNLIQRNPTHYFVLTGTAEAFPDFEFNLEQFPQWQTVALSDQYIQNYIEQQNLIIEDDGLIELVRQPWAFGTLKSLVNQGQFSFSQASILRGRIDYQINQLSNSRSSHLSNRVRQTLIETASEMKAAQQSDLSIDQFFQLMKTVRNERTYDLEALFVELVRRGIVSTLQRNGSDVIQFREGYIFSILYALAMSDNLSKIPDFVASYDLTTPDARLALILMAQLDDDNMDRIVRGLLKRLREPKLRLEWPTRLEILDIAVHCAGPKFWQLKERLRLQILEELGSCILKDEDEDSFKDWLDAQSFTTAPTPLKETTLNGQRLSSPDLRSHVLELLAATKAPHSLEILRVFVMGMGDPTMRQKALQLLRELDRWAKRIENRLQQRPPEAEQLTAQEELDAQKIKTWRAFISQEPLEPVSELLDVWNQIRRQEAGPEQLEAWLLDDTVAWRSSAAVIPLTDVSLRQQALTEQTTKLLLNQFQASANEASVSLMAESLIMLAVLPGQEALLKTIQDIMIEIAPQRPNDDDKCGWLRQFKAIDLLGKLKVEDALIALIRILNDSDQEFRIHAKAAWAIGRICAEYPTNEAVYKARRALMQAIKTTYGWPQQEAIKALGLCYPDEETKDFLIEFKAQRQAEVDNLMAEEKEKAESLPTKKGLALESLEEPDMAVQKGLDKIRRVISNENYAINLIDKVLPKCDVKSKPGYSLSY